MLRTQIIVFLLSLTIMLTACAGNINSNLGVCRTLEHTYGKMV